MTAARIIEVACNAHARRKFDALDGVRGALQFQNRVDERPAEQVADRDHHEQRRGDGDDELALQLRGIRVGLARRLLDSHRPAERRNLRGDA